RRRHTRSKRDWSSECALPIYGNITHVSGKVDPADDIETINLELILSDLETVNKRYEKAIKMAKSKDHDAIVEANALAKVKEVLEAGKSARTVTFTEEEQPFIDRMFVLTTKPILYVANVSEDDAATGNDYVEIVCSIPNEES